MNLSAKIKRMLLFVVIGFILTVFIAGTSAASGWGPGITGLVGVIALIMLWQLLKKANIGGKNDEQKPED
jgi:hypothetical protein